MIIGRGGASDAVREGICEETMRACCKLLRKIPAGLLAIALAASCCRLKEEWTAFVGGTTISAGGRRQDRKWEACGRVDVGEEGSGDGEGVWTGMDADMAEGGAGCC